MGSMYGGEWQNKMPVLCESLSELTLLLQLYFIINSLHISPNTSLSSQGIIIISILVQAFLWVMAIFFLLNMIMKDPHFRTDTYQEFFVLVLTSEPPLAKL